MASRTTNERVLALRARHAAEEQALEQVAASERAARTAAEKRDAVLARANAEVAEAERDHDVALAVLAVLLRDDDSAASIAGVDVTRIRTARRRVPDGEVQERITVLSAPRPQRRRRATATASRPDGGGVGRSDGDAGLAVVPRSIGEQVGG